MVESRFVRPNALLRAAEQPWKASRSRLIAGLCWSLFVLTEPGVAVAVGVSEPGIPARTLQTLYPSRPGDDARAEVSAQRTPIRRPGTEADIAHSERTASTATAGPWTTLLVLAAIVGGLCISTRFLKRFSPSRFGGLPAGVLDHIGSQMLTPQHCVHLVRLGDRLLVIGSGAEGLRTLSEITDPAEVQHLTLLCRSANPTAVVASASSTLRGKSAPDTPAATVAKEEIPPFGGAAAEEYSRRSSMHRLASWFLFLALLPSLAHAQGVSDRPGQIPLRAVEPGVAGVADAAASAPAGRISSAGNNGPAQAARSSSSGPAMDSWEGPEGTTDSTMAQVAVATPPPDLAAALARLTPTGAESSLKLAVVVGVLSLAPAILLMTTCYIRIVVVLGILRQALGVPQFPPTQVLTAFSLFLTATVMWPVWDRAYREGIEPYSRAATTSPAGQQAAFSEALQRSAQPIRQFMSRQIEATDNTAAVDLFLEYHTPEGQSAAPVEYYEDVPLQALLPAYVLSELKVAFLIGFQIYLPFVVLDLVVTSLLTTLGLNTLSPGVVSLPFKLLLFVLIDGWFLTVELLLNSIAPLT